VIVSVSHIEWQVLRCVLRAELAGSGFPLGRELRVVPTRKTKDGTFLDDLVERGLIEVAAKASALPTSTYHGERVEPPQFRTRYRLTDLGRHAAEYGEYDRTYTPTPQPVTGVAAELFESLAALERNWEAAETPTKRKGGGGAAGAIRRRRRGTIR
jgi:hypothetical protein